MVCTQQITKQSTRILETEALATHFPASTGDNEKKKALGPHSGCFMDFEGEEDTLQLQHLAGGIIVQHPPIYGPNGEFLFVIKDRVIQIYSTLTGEVTRQLTGATSKILSMEFELKNEKVLMACTAAGEILRWKWETTSSAASCMPMRLPDVQVLTCNLINFYGNSDTACAFVTAKMPRVPVQWYVVDTSNGKKLQVKSNLRLINKKPVLVAVDTKNFKNIVVVQGFYLYFIKYDSWTYTRLMNAHRVNVTVVRMHPKEEVVATGDENGRIFLWRQFHSQHEVVTSLYHWHHTEVTSIAFSPSGSSFYSSGLESVLVKWNVRNDKMRDFLPRFPSIILHIATSHGGNSQVAFCTADNGVHLLEADKSVKRTLQEFTYIVNDKTGLPKFPVGLRVNPRTNTLVLNGRIGHLQFYSVYNKSLFYNMDIVAQNQLSIETGKILYNIRVTKAAFNIDWMVTGEVYNDEEHLPELRLKFWKYKEEIQNYALNTVIELPHEGGFKAIEFSSDNQVENLLCATVGEDNIIKMWSLEETDDIHKEGKFWYCICETSYKSMTIESISFSEDGSLLAAGFGNTLCIYVADTLKLKAALTGRPGADGCVPKAQIRIADQAANDSKSKYGEHRRKIMQLLINFLESNDDALITELRKCSDIGAGDEEKSVLTPLEELDEKQKKRLYNEIIGLNELSLFQKVLLFQKLKISCQVQPQWQQTLAKYLCDTVAEASKQERYARLRNQLNRVNIRDRFKAKYKLHRFATRKRIYDEEITRNLVPIMSTMNLNENTKQPELRKSNTETQREAKEAGDTSLPAANPLANSYSATKKILLPTNHSATIRRVQFAAGEHAHLIIVCTQHRVLIWNLLTLRLQSVLKISVQHLTLDPLTNVIAAFTQNNELYIFQPNVPIPIYHRRNLPNIHGAIWLVRSYPKPRSINLDWQAQSILYFLTESQEIMYLGCNDDASSCDAPPPLAFKNDAIPELRYSTFGTFATKQINETQTKTRQKGPLIIGLAEKTAVKTLTELSTHAMPPLSLLCSEFVRTLVKSTDSTKDRMHQSKHKNRGSSYTNHVDDGDVIMNGNGKMHISDDDDDDSDGKVTTIKRKSLLTREQQELSKEQFKLGSSTQSDTSANFTEAQLVCIAEQTIELEI